jgi:hypothetical protein
MASMLHGQDPCRLSSRETHQPLHLVLIDEGDLQAALLLQLPAGSRPGEYSEFGILKQ